MAAKAPTEAGVQTVENAGLFLSRIMLGHKIFFDDVPRGVTVLGGRGDERCVLHFKVHGDEMIIGDRTWQSVDSDDFYYDFRGVTDVSSAGKTGVKLRMLVAGDGVHTITFDLDSENLQARVAYAAEFLRQNCDETRSTGF